MCVVFGAHRGFSIEVRTRTECHPLRQSFRSPHFEHPIPIPASHFLRHSSLLESTFPTQIVFGNQKFSPEQSAVPGASRIDLGERRGREVPEESKSKSAPAKSSTTQSVTYADAGVDITRGDRAKERIKYLAQKTFNRNVLGGIGGFGALFRLDLQKFKSPILVSSADGVGTKLKIAFEMGLHSSVGADLVNHCVNDIAVQGATPLFFLDYFASGKLDPEVTETVVSGLAEACQANGCALIGGETAQMPGFYAEGEYDLAGFIVGAVDRDKLVTGADDQARRRARSDSPRPASTPTATRSPASCSSRWRATSHRSTSPPSRRRPARR